MILEVFCFIEKYSLKKGKKSDAFEYIHNKNYVIPSQKQNSGKLKNNNHMTESKSNMQTAY